ncbi:hypothetical protein ASPBRDRAFT_182601 [Aspergillus brasiliensis CBS 101740]|uniref:Muramidase n=1 Tax=Aspergillus brasiliensis (strain CBS 101740 / IMI 381727 / IBT 21946) TaxID=767769 RepID=A0A1L9UD39_ASPBC|nr:hypothetical protein ASPBRDRAFT_182601 [Aspergillus brasiliensis CBS 101740]
MIARTIIRSPHLSNKITFPPRRCNLIRLPARKIRPVHITPPLSPFRNAPSRRTPELESWMNCADNIERLLDQDKFKTWGFVIYRCTYQSDSGWETFMVRLHKRVEEFLRFYNGLDLLGSFAPTVLENRSFEGATVVSLRQNFNKWAMTAVVEEQGIGPSKLLHLKNGRYRFFIMVDQEALDSILSTSEDGLNGGFVRLVNAEWKPEELDEELAERGGPPPPEEPLEGCTEEDVGWMKVRWRGSQVPGYEQLGDSFMWDLYYSRPPVIQSIT